MKIKEIKIENFGKLSHYTLSMTDGLNRIVESNGWGKTTLACFVKAMFYGLEGDRKKGLKDNERVRFKPWQSGVYGGSLTFETGGKEYRIIRSFGNSQRDDSFALYDNVTGLPSKDYSESIGEELFELDRESFNDTIFFKENNLDTVPTAGINAKLGSLSKVTDDISSFDEVADRFKKKLNALSPDKVTGLLNELKNRITELENQEKQIEVIDNSIDKLNSMLDNNKKAEAELKAEISALQKTLAKAALRDRLMAKKEEYDGLLRRRMERSQTMDAFNINTDMDIDDAESKVNKLIKMNGEARSKKESISAREEAGNRLKTTRILIYATYILCLVAGAVLVFYSHYMAGGITIAVSIIAAIITLMVIKKEQQKTSPEDVAFIKETKEQTEEFLKSFDQEVVEEAYVDGLLSIRTRISAYRAAKSELERIDKEIADFKAANEVRAFDSISETGVSVADISRLIEEKNKSYDYIRDVIADYEGQIGALLEKRDEAAEASAMKEAIKEDYQQLYKRYELISKTSQLLDKARGSFVARYCRPVSESFNKYYEKLEREDKRKFSFDTYMNLMIEDMGNYRDLEAYSAGTRDRINIAFRMALIETMYRKEKPIIIMDDPFVHFDGERLNRAKDVLADISREYQILYLTCLENRPLTFTS